MKPTPTQRRALMRLSRGDRIYASGGIVTWRSLGWSRGSRAYRITMGTFNALLNRGWIAESDVLPPDQYVITEAGLKALKEA